jgi:hypothetical protein
VSGSERCIERASIRLLQEIVERNQIWDRMAAKYGVDNPVPPWKSSLDGMCDALDRSPCATTVLSFLERRRDEDTLSATAYPGLPYPESQLVALAHSLVVRGVIDETELQERIAAIRARLEADAAGRCGGYLVTRRYVAGGAAAGVARRSAASSL